MAMQSQAAVDLGLGGLGDDLARQLREQEEQRKKKLMNGVASTNSYGMASMQLLGSGQ
jgi:hypothetical protein